MTKVEKLQLTKEAYDNLLVEMENRKSTIREEIANEISVARELGDLRENQAYSFAMDKRERNEARIVELEEILKNIEIVKEADLNSKIVRIGSTVKITYIESRIEKIITLSGSEATNSSNPLEGIISIDSPLGKAIFNSKIGESVTVILPNQKKITVQIDFAN